MFDDLKCCSLLEQDYWPNSNSSNRDFSFKWSEPSWSLRCATFLSKEKLGYFPEVACRCFVCLKRQLSFFAGWGWSSLDLPGEAQRSSACQTPDNRILDGMYVSNISFPLSLMWLHPICHSLWLNFHSWCTNCWSVVLWNAIFCLNNYPNTSWLCDGVRLVVNVC